MTHEPSRTVYEFGPFQLDVTRRELRRGPTPVKLYPKEFDTLLALVERHGQVVKKDELLRRVWPDATVEEGNLTTHVSHLRKLLGGSSARDYIVTVPGSGYQFVAALKAPEAGRAPGRNALRSFFGLVAIVLVSVTAIGIVFWSRRAPRADLRFHQLTFHRGTIWSARFAPDGRTIVYGAAWNGRPIELYSTRSDAPESRPLGLDGDILSIAASGEMAVAAGRSVDRFWDRRGRLVQLPLAGGAPRDILDAVKDADWAPDGRTLAVVRRVERRDHLEFPIGEVIRQVEGFIMCPRVSRTADAVAFLQRHNGAESVELITRGGEQKTLAPANGETGLAWSRSGDELLYTVFNSGTTELRAVRLDGRQRTVTEIAGEWALLDISSDGRTLMVENHTRGQISGLTNAEPRERDLSWLDRSVAVDLSSDGRTLLLSEIGAAGGQNKAVYIRNMDGSPALKLGEGEAAALSPDGKWAIANLGSAPERLVLLPTGAGRPRALPNGAVTDYYRVTWLPDGRHIVFGGIEPGYRVRLYVQDVSAGDPRLATDRDPKPGTLFLPDGRSFVARVPERGVFLFRKDSSAPAPVAAVSELDHLIQSSSDGKSIFVGRRDAGLGTVYRVDLSTGRRETWKQITVADTAGVMRAGPEFPAFLMTRDGKAYAYNYLRVLSELFLVDGVN